MNHLLEPILTLILNYGYPIVFLCIIGGYTGLPIPSNAVLVAAGSFSSTTVMNASILLPLAVVTAVVGDIIGYYLGYRYGHLVLNKITRRMGLTQLKLDILDTFLLQWGGWCIFLTRWLLTPLAIPTNLVAGSSRYPFKNFIVLSFVGESMWAGGYIYLGYILGSNWASILDYINSTPQLLALIVVGIGSVLLSLHIWRKRRR